MDLLQVKSLHIRYKDRELLDLPELSIRKGEVYGIIGESGSGKSLLLLAIMGLLPKGIAADGFMEFHTETGMADLLRLSPDVRRSLMSRNLGMVFQEPMSALNPRMTCGDQLSEIFKLHTTLTGDLLREEVHRALKESGLDETERIASSYPFQISGGQRQRVMIAMATAMKPDLVLADEPTTALDPETGAEVLDTLVKRCRDLGSSLILVSHDLGSVARYADSIAVLRKGVLVTSGKTDTVLAGNVNPYVQELLEAARRIERKLPENAQAVLEIKGLSKAFRRGIKRNVVLNDFNISVLKGETLTILGKSGSGKSTLAKILTGLEKADSGDVQYLGKSILDKAVTGIQMVFQDPYSSLNNEMRCGEIVSEVLRVIRHKGRAEANEKAAKLLESVGLGQDFFHKYPHQLSGGQRQRLCIARALATDPQILILDEAVAALDPLVQKQVLDLLQKIQEETGIVYLFITHDHLMAGRFGHRQIRLGNG